MEYLAAQSFSFADFELNGAKRLLLKQGETVSLNSKTFDLLAVLLENHGQILSKEELLDKVWENQFVEENNLTVHVSALRKALGETKDDHRFIVTIPGRGYSFVAKVERFCSENHALADPDPKPNTTNSLEFLGKKGNVTRGEGSIIGRHEEIAEIKNLFRRDGGECRLIILTGAGGSGKTSLAKAVAEELSGDFPDGVAFVELAAVQNADLVALTIAVSLGVDETNDLPLIESLKAFLRKRQMLLILDNFEKLVSAAPFVKEIIASSPGLIVLVTSRVALPLSGEVEFAVLPLAVPPKDVAFSAGQLIAYPSVWLFVARARSSKKSFRLTDSNASTVAEICRRLDGLPLAIELAAARVRLLSVESILSRMDKSLQLLTGGAQDMPERQRTMRGTVEWSYDLLDEGEKAVFRRLAVFAGGFTVEAAEAVIGERSPKASETGPLKKTERFESTAVRRRRSALDDLTSLLDSSLLVSKEQADGSTRLQMLEVVREFALEMLEEAGELEDLQRRHSHVFLALAEEAEPFLYGANAFEWLEKLENDHDNLRAALSWSREHEPETAARIAADLRFFWQSHSHFSEGLGWCQAALQVTENTVTETRCILLQAISLFLRHRGEFDAARQYTEISLAESRELNHLPQIHRAIHSLGSIAVVQKDFAAAETYYREALELSRQMKDQQQIAYTLGSLGDLEMCKGNYSAARIFLEECRILSEGLGETPVGSTIYYNLGAIDFSEKLYDEAAENFAKSLRICQELGFKSMMSCALDGFAALSAVGGRYQRSAQIAGAVDSLRDSIVYNNEPAEEAFRNEYLTKVRAVLDEKTFTALYEKGRNMNSDEVALVVKRLVSTEEPGALDRSAVGYPDEQVTEVVIENHSFSRIVIEEEIESEDNGFGEQ
jgi:non-specific serine/threonine protein kinase